MQCYCSVSRMNFFQTMCLLTAMLLFVLKNEIFLVVCLLIALLLVGLKNAFIPDGVSSYCNDSVCSHG